MRKISMAHEPGTHVSVPPFTNREMLADIVVRAVAVEQKVDAVGKQLEEFLGRLNDIP